MVCACKNLPPRLFEGAEPVGSTFSCLVPSSDTGSAAEPPATGEPRTVSESPGPAAEQPVPEDVLPLSCQRNASSRSSPASQSPRQDCVFPPGSNCSTQHSYSETF